MLGEREWQAGKQPVAGRLDRDRRQGAAEIRFMEGRDAQSAAGSIGAEPPESQLIVGR